LEDKVKDARWLKIPAMTLKTAHSVGLSGITTWMGIQNGGFALELQKKYSERWYQNINWWTLGTNLFSY